MIARFLAWLRSDQDKRRAADVLAGEVDDVGQVAAALVGVLPPEHPWAQLLASVPKTSPEDDELLAGDSEAEPPPGPVGYF